MTTGIKWAWRKTFGKAHYDLSGKIDVLLDHLNGGGKLAVIEKMVTGIQKNVNDVVENQEDYYALVSARLDADHQLVVLTNAKGKVTNISRAFQEYTGYTLDMMAGDGWISLIHPEDRSHAVRQWDSVVRAGAEMSEDQRYVHVNGRVLHVHIKVYRQRDSKKRIRGYLAIIHPLEDHKLCPYSANPEVCAAAHQKNWDCEYTNDVG